MGHVQARQHATEYLHGQNKTWHTVRCDGRMYSMESMHIWLKSYLCIAVKGMQH